MTIHCSIFTIYRKLFASPNLKADCRSDFYMFGPVAEPINVKCLKMGHGGELLKT